MYFLIPSLASKCSSKDTQEILNNFARVLRLGFGGTLAKAFASQNKIDGEERSHEANHRKDELDKLISGLFLDIFVDMDLLLENPQSMHDFESMSATKMPLMETLFPVSQWLLLPVDVQFQVYIKNNI